MVILACGSRILHCRPQLSHHGLLDMTNKADRLVKMLIISFFKKPLLLMRYV